MGNPMTDEDIFQEMEEKIAALRVDKFVLFDECVKLRARVAELETGIRNILNEISPCHPLWTKTYVLLAQHNGDKT